MPPTSTFNYEVELKRSLAASILGKMSRDNLSISALAERMGTGRTGVRRILDAKNTSITFRSMSRAAQAVGLQIKLIAEPMAPADLGKLAHRLAKSKSRAGSAKLKAWITEGFYAGSQCQRSCRAFRVTVEALPGSSRADVEPKEKAG